MVSCGVHCGYFRGNWSLPHFSVKPIFPGVEICIRTIRQLWDCLIYVMGILTQIARFMGPTWGPPGDDRTQVGPMLAPWTLLSDYTGDMASSYWNDPDVTTRVPWTWFLDRWHLHIEMTLMLLPKCSKLDFLIDNNLNINVMNFWVKLSLGKL